ncbi:MAG: transglutaminase-like domain-containing protein [Brevefilum sp.]|nr:transglutaminase-like domain-containing protein [Brevefilum sp.]
MFFLRSSFENLFNLSSEFVGWISRLGKEQAIFNPKINDVFWGTILWIATFASGWMFRRKNHAFTASLPILSILIGILGYTRQNTQGLILALAVLLLMIVVFEHLRHEEEWDTHNIDYSEALRGDVAFLGIPTILAIMLIASALPNIPYDAITEFRSQMNFMEDQNQSRFDKSLGLQKIPQEPFPGSTSGVLPRQFLIGSGSELSENLVMEIDTREVFLPPEIDINSTLPKYYWFGRSYDTYTGNGWVNSEIATKTYSENEIIIAADLNHSRLLNQKINKSNTALETLYASGIPQTVDHRITAGWRETTNEYYSAQINALSYEVNSPVLLLSEEELRQSTETIPEEILQTYLQIPEEMPQRVYELASTITQDSSSVYDKAKAIESYLRQFEYSLDIPTPNPNLDVVDYFLFDLQKGYCDYFASAMVILSRSVNIPARIAVGYATGQYDYARQIFVVTEDNAHAWPEIYIPPYGWVPFEPTTSLIPFSWDTHSDYSMTFPNVNDPGDMANEESSIWLNLFILAGSIFVLLVAGFVWYRLSTLKTRKSQVNQQIEKIYQRMNKHLTGAFISPQLSRTPHELYQDAADFLNKQGSSQLNKRLKNQIEKNIHNITNLYIQGIYSPGPLSISQVNTARQNLSKLLTQTRILKIFLIISR